MDPVTHALTGWCIARTGIAGDSRWAMLGIVTASLAADIDVIHLVGGVGGYVRHSGTWSHSLSGAAIFGAACAAGIWGWGRKWKTELPLAKLTAACVLAAVVHSLLDAAASSGVALLYPVQVSRTALDWMPMTDLLLLALFVVALFLPWLFSLIQEEIGARRKSAPRWGAWLAIIGMVFIISLRSVNHDRIAGRMNQMDFGERTVRKTGVFPAAANPFRWRGIAETEDTIEILSFDLVRGKEETAGSYFKPASNPAISAAQQSPLVKTFLSRARFPRASVKRTSRGLLVEIVDMSCPAERALCPQLIATAEVDSDNQVTKTSIRWGPFATEQGAALRRE